MASTATVRKPNLSRYYGRKLSSVTPGEFEFDLTLLRGAGAPPVPLGPVTESFEWNEDDTNLTGNVQLRRPDPAKPGSLPIRSGYRIRCRTHWKGEWYEVWTMRCDAPELTIDEGGNVSVSVDLKDDMYLVSRGRRHWIFRKTKRRKHGWFGHDALRVAARREGIRLGAIAKCLHRMDKIDVNGSFLDLAVKVYKHEREKTGRRFVLRMRNGRFEAVPYRRNTTVYVLAEQMRTVALKEQPAVANPATILSGTARLGKGKAAKKIRHTEYRRDMVRRFGRVERKKNYGHVSSAAELRSKVRRDLAKNYRVNTTLTVQHQGIPFIRRGDAAQCVLASEGFKGAQSWVFATGARHQVQGESYTSEFDFNRVDLFLKDREAREKEARAKARRRRKQRRRG